MRTLASVLFVSVLVTFASAGSGISGDLSNYLTAINNLLDANGRSLNGQETTVPVATNTAMNSGNTALENLRNLASNPSLTTKRKNYVTYDAPTQMAMMEQASQMANIQARVEALNQAREQRAAEYASTPNLDVDGILQSQDDFSDKLNSAVSDFINDNSVSEQNKAEYQAYKTGLGSQQKQAVRDSINMRNEAQSYFPTAFTSEERNVFDALSKRLSNNQ